VGSAILPARDGGAFAGADGPEPATPTWNQLGTAACVGLAALVAVGGAAMVLRVPPLLAAALFVAAGLVLLAVRATPRRRPLPRGGALIGVLLLAGAAACALVVQASVGITTWPNPCDDLLAYIPLADRLLATSQVVEPWSLRRLQSLGGQTFLQATLMGTLGDGAFATMETLTATTSLGGLFVAAPFRRLASLTACVTVVLVVAVLAVPRVNSAAVLLPVPLVVAGFGAVSEMRATLGGRSTAVPLRWAAAAGLLLAAVVALRIHTGPALGAVVVLGVLTAPAMPVGARWQALATAGGAAALALVPWGIASWLSSGTPAYPLIGGNGNPEVPQSQDPSLHGVRDNAARAAELVQVGPYLGAALAVLVVALAVRRWLPDAWLVVLAAAAVVANMAVLGAVLTVSADLNFARYTSPLSIALVVFFVYEAVRGSEAPATGRLPRITRPLVLLAAAAAILGHVSDLFTPAGGSVMRASIDSARATLADGGHRAKYDDLLAAHDVRDDYTAALDLAAGGGRVIAAVDHPYLIDYERHDDIPSLDLPGWAAPGGDFPFFQGTAAKVRILRGQGYSQLLATAPERHACLNADALRAQIAADTSTFAPYFLDWSDGLTEIVETAPGAVRRVGSLLLIDLAAAERELAAAPR
jgi:hypothetical protein